MLQGVVSAQCYIERYQVMSPSSAISSAAPEALQCMSGQHASTRAERAEQLHSSYCTAMARCWHSSGQQTYLPSSQSEPSGSFRMRIWA